MNLAEIRELLRSYALPEKAEFLPRFFKTGKGEYAEGDKFLGVIVPKTRRVSKKSKDLSWDDIESLMQSEWHEERLLALFILGRRFRFGKSVDQKQVIDFYLENVSFVNNWDLVDSSADKLLGEYILMNPESVEILRGFAKSFSLWERRIAMVATFAFLKRKQSAETYKIALILMRDKEDLIHKAVGWMLREAGKRVSEPELVTFLREHCKIMPRTMLRYAIEKLDEPLRNELMGR